MLLNLRDKMSRLTRSHIYLSVFMCTCGTLAGWLITDKLAGSEASSSFLKFGMTVEIVILMAQLAFLIKGTKRAKFLILFNGAFSMSLVWFLSCLALPIFFMPLISDSSKVSLLSFALTLCIFNIVKGADEFNARWANVGDKLLIRYYQKVAGVIDWSGVVDNLKLSISIYIPGLPKKFEPVLSVGIVISMLAGLSLRNSFPNFSVFAWGIPSIIGASFFMQTLGVCFGQFRILCDLEEKDKVSIKPA